MNKGIRVKRTFFSLIFFLLTALTSFQVNLLFAQELPKFFNNDGVFRVFTQIIISIFSLNTRESGSLNEVGKIEANRAAYAYMLNWVNQSS